MALCLIALGSNEGDRPATLSRAIGRLAAHTGFDLRGRSTWHETAPVGGPADQQTYLNGAAIVETSHSPAQVLATLAEIETSLGRVRAVHWGPRTIDLDLLLYDDVQLDTPRLVLPHPRMAFRKFVVEPAAEIAPDWRHPAIGWTLLQLRDHLRFAVPYVAVTGRPGVGKTALAAQLATQLDARLIADVPELSAAPSSKDSAGRARAAEIELLTRRCMLLDPHRWGAKARLAISDFWLEQSRAYVSAWNDGHDRKELEGLIDAASSEAVRPKLLVLLDPPGEPSAVDRNEALRRALRATAQQPGVGPVLIVSEGSPTAQVAEVTAAIAAMS